MGFMGLQGVTGCCEVSDVETDRLTVIGHAAAPPPPPPAGE